jgi:predicted nucleic acid-binding protein
MRTWRAVIDTNVLVEGLTRRGTPCGLILDARSGRQFQPCVSNSIIYEYLDVLPRKLSPARWTQIRPVLRGLLDLTEYVDINFSWRPSSPDPGDEHVIDCAMIAGAVIVTSNLRDFQPGRADLGLSILSPTRFLIFLDELEEPTTTKDKP